MSIFQRVIDSKACVFFFILVLYDIFYGSDLSLTYSFLHKILYLVIKKNIGLHFTRNKSKFVFGLTEN